jgi:predicted glycosyltransferase
MRILIYLGHPAHFHLFRWVIRDLRSQGHALRLLISRKDVLEDLLRNDGLEYTVVMQGRRGKSQAGMLRSLLSRAWRIRKELRAWRPQLMAGTSAEGPLVARLFGIPFINLNEDDHDVVPLYSKLSYPFSSCILMPEGCRAGRWEGKALHYPGFHELAYLHPARFTPDPDRAKAITGDGPPYVLLRFSALNAHHDQGIRGITTELAMRMISEAGKDHRIFITSEKPLPASLEPYRLALNPLDIHHVMAGARLYVGDSQTMAAESAMLGVPYIRYNDFVGRITYLAQLEDQWELGYGFRPGQEDAMMERYSKVLELEHGRPWTARRDLLLRDKIDTAAFISWFLSNYPRSAGDAAKPDFDWNRFRYYPGAQG